MEKALRILDDAIKALESEVRIWTKQGDLDIVEKCKNEIKQCTEAIEKLRGGECSNDNSGLNIPVVIARFLKEQATEYKTEQNNIVIGLMQEDLYIWDFDGGRAMQDQWQTKKIIDEPLNGL